MQVFFCHFILYGLVHYLSVILLYTSIQEDNFRNAGSFQINYHHNDSLYYYKGEIYIRVVLSIHLFKQIYDDRFQYLFFNKMLYFVLDPSQIRLIGLYNMLLDHHHESLFFFNEQ